MVAPDQKPADGTLAAEGYTLFQQKGCSGCHRIDGLYDTAPLHGNGTTTPAAPNLTKLFTRDCFAGCIYDLNNPNELEAWLRNPQRKAGSLMVIAQLSESEIDRLVAYLHTLR